MKQFLTFLMLVLSTTVVAQTFCYQDKDKDGFGDPFTAVLSTVFGCPSEVYTAVAWVNNGLDCDDTKACINPNTIWYKDNDNDGYTDGVTADHRCERPQGYKCLAEFFFGIANLDCDDSDPYVLGTTRDWRADPDNDHYLEYLAPALQQVCRPNGYIAYPSEVINVFRYDCNENDSLEHPDQKWFKDEDGDKYPADLTDSVACNRPNGYSAESELIAFTLDCADDEASLNPGTVWYRDSDDDGYSDGSTLLQCDQPTGYKKTVSAGIDCNDNNLLEHPNQVWVLDNDGDRHGRGFLVGGSVVVQCLRPVGYFAVSELTSVGDCNDGNIAIHPGAEEICDNADNNCNGQIDEGFTTFSFVIDADGDGFYPGSPIVQCASPGAGYIILTQVLIVTSGEVISNKSPGDCDDNNGAINPASKWVLDADGDRYYPGSPIVQCISPGAGYILLTYMPIVPVGLVPNKSPGDCNDNAPGIHPNATEICDGVDNDCDGLIDEGGNLTFYKDFDGDGYGNAAISTQACSAPAGYVSNNTDCNDNAPAINPGTVWYKDADNDRYSDGTPRTQCERPTGYKLISELMSMFGFFFGDCDDNNAAIHPQTVWYQDFDNDGYSTGFNFMGCGRIPGWKLPSELIATGGDCNDNNAVLNPATIWYKDTDNDAYSNGATQIQCTRPTNHKLASELTATSGDCDDNNAVLNPATIWYKDTDNDAYSNGTTQIQCTRPTNHKLASELIATSGDCNDTDPTVNPASVEVCNNNKDDNCNGVQNEAGCYTCGNATSFSTTNVTSNSATLNWVSIPHPNFWQVQYKAPGTKWTDVTPDPAGNQRSVTINGLIPNKNYLWHIKAKCGNGWTSYSVSVPFTTAGGITARSEETTNAEMEASEVAIGSLQVKASPNPSNTSFRITLNSNNLKEPVKLIITDMLGRVIETRTTNAGQIIIGEKYRSGTYVVRIIQGKETRQLKLIKLPD